jgi:hypothetical protein
MLTLLYNTVRDRSGTAVLFPLRFVTVLKNAVPLILEAGTWMKMDVDENDQCVVVPKRVDTPFSRSTTVRFNNCADRSPGAPPLPVDEGVELTVP